MFDTRAICKRRGVSLLAAIVLSGWALGATALIVPPTVPNGSYYEMEFVVTGGETRTYLLSLPPGYVHGQANLYPLVYYFHGGGMTALDSWTNRADLRAIADANNVITVFPQGHEAYPLPPLLALLFGDGYSWNAMHCCGETKFYDVDDVGYIEELTAYLLTELDVNSDRIHATGFSNGAMLTHRLGAELPHVFASIAPVAGGAGGYSADRAVHDYYPVANEWVSFFTSQALPTPPGLDWNPQEVVTPLASIPVLLIRGFEDDIVPYYGGQPTDCASGPCWGWWRYDLPAYPEIGNPLSSDWEIWETANGCTVSPFGFIHVVWVDDAGAINPVGDFITCDAIAAGSATLRLLVLTTMSHQWPTWDNAKFDGALRVMEFFRRHPR